MKIPNNLTVFFSNNGGRVRSLGGSQSLTAPPHFYNIIYNIIVQLNFSANPGPPHLLLSGHKKTPTGSRGSFKLKNNTNYCKYLRLDNSFKSACHSLVSSQQHTKPSSNASRVPGHVPVHSPPSPLLQLQLNR